MRTSSLAPAALTLAFALSFALACGDDGDGNGDIADAGNPDAAAFSGLGEVCVLATPDCPVAAPMCITTSAAGGEGFCSVSCGTTPEPPAGMMPTPPANGNQLCADAFMGEVGTDGTPACVLFGAAQGGQVPWACGVACGMVGGTNLGGCPSGLTCGANLANLCEP
jgi:hypothetical protein